MTDALAQVLAGFRSFQVRRRCVPERQLPFFLSWTQRFLEFATARPPGAFGECRLAYLEDLRRGDRLEWQVEQADRAVRLYYHEFRHADAGEPSGVVHDGRPGGPPARAPGRTPEALRPGRPRRIPRKHDAGGGWPASTRRQRGTGDGSTSSRPRA